MAVSEQPPFDLRIVVSRYAERLADVIARVKALPGSVPQFVIVGQASRVDRDGDAKEKWKAWLWPEGGVTPGTGRHTEAVTRPSCGDLEVLLNGRLKGQGRWWSL